MRPKLILDTDIGTDVDDAYALLLALGCSEFDVAAITLVHANLDIREKITFKMLRLAGRLDIPVARGWSSTLSGTRKEHWGGHEGTDTDFSDIRGLKADDDAVDLILRLVRDNPGEVIVAAVGPMTNIAAAIQKDPETMGKVRRIVLMASVFKGTGAERASGEHNAGADPEASAVVLQSGLPITLVGLNVTLQVVLSMARVQSLAKISPLGDYAAAMGEQFLRLSGLDATWMHDPLAVAIAVKPGIATTIPLKAFVQVNGPMEGSVVYEKAKPGEPSIDVCIAVDIAAFEDMFFSGIARVVRGDA